MSEMKALELEPVPNENIPNKPAIRYLIETLEELKNNSHEGITINIDLTIENILIPISRNEPRVVGLVRDIQEYSQSNNTQQMRLDELLSRLETTNYLQEPTVIIPVSRSKNPTLPGRLQVDDFDLSM